MWQVIRLFLFIKINFIYGKLSGDHICLVEEEFLVNVTETYLRNTTIRNYHWCYNVPPRCSYYTVKQVNDTRVVEKNDTRIVEACCSGFIENEEEQCIPSCPICKNGICENGNCNCFSGYKGDTCDLECSNGKWGPHCLKSCNCPNNKCNSKTGNCLEKTTTALSTAAVKKTTTRTITTVSPATIITEKTTYDRGTTIITKINTPEEEITDKISNGGITKSLISSLSAVSTVSSIFNNTKTKEDTITETSKTSPRVPSESTMKNNSTQVIETLIENSTNIQKFLITIQFNKTNPTEKSNSTFSSSSESLKEVEVTTKMNEFATNSSVTFLNAPIATNEGLLIPVEINYDQKQKPTTYGSTAQDKNVVSVTNEEYLNRKISNNFSSNDFALFGITVLMTSMLVVTILSINFLRKKRKKDGTKNEEHQVSVFSASIFHSPLPDPPVTENPLYLNSVKCRKGSLKELSTFETRIVCNVNSTPRSPINEMREFEYDHPPSTENYRTASLVDPLEAKKSSFQDYVVEPLYDEILQMENEQNSSASSVPMSIYINTCGRTKF